MSSHRPLGGILCHPVLPRSSSLFADCGSGGVVCVAISMLLQKPSISGVYGSIVLCLGADGTPHLAATAWRICHVGLDDIPAAAACAVKHQSPGFEGLCKGPCLTAWFERHSHVCHHMHAERPPANSSNLFADLCKALMWAWLCEGCLRDGWPPRWLALAAGFRSASHSAGTTIRERAATTRVRSLTQS